MAQVKLNLQPPPNVDFVTGYPGIPPGPDRPQASVKGAIEVRVPPAGVKAKWVRIELRKVEVLPGEGSGNTYYDYVGPSPVNLWSTSDEYGVLRSQDFPFSIRIPESIPPTIALNNRASIGYELLASVCTKGKRGFLRKAKSVVVSITAPVIIDKHELHSTWPVYCQPETRHLAQDDVNLIVERNRTCFGPGDRISVVATVKSDSLQHIILRGFEISLREVTAFRPGISPGKRAVPQVTQIGISENKVAVNATVYGGTSHTAELACMVPANHTTPTLTAARHIDVTYTLSVRALMGTGTHLTMDLPIVMSNWQRDVSFEAINRIGPSPGLSIFPQSSSAVASNRADPVRTRPSDAVAATLPNRTQLDGAYGSQRNNPAFNTAPTSSPAVRADEFGNTQRTITQTANTAVPGSAAVASPPPAAIPGARSNSSGGGSPPTVSSPTSLPATVPLPQQDASNETRRTPSAAATKPAVPNPYQSAEDEKVKLYEKARERAAKVQGLAATPPSANATPQANPPPPAAVPPPSPPAQPNRWLTAEEEKRRLFENAQAAALKTQSSQIVPSQITVTPSQSRRSPDIQSSLTSKPSAAAALYAEAINAQHRSSAAQAGGSSSSPPPKVATVPHLTAEQEKAALKRYEEAKMAVDRIQNANFGPIAYDSLFPAGSSSQPPPPLVDDKPPSFDNAVSGPSNIMAIVSEKERLRREYEARDAAALAEQNQSPPPAPYSVSYNPPPPLAPTPSTPAQYANAQEEKEALRKKFEARDAQMAITPPQPSPPPVSHANGINEVKPAPRSPNAMTGGSRPPPTPPSSAPAYTHVLTAAEEKALLKAKYEGYGSSRKGQTSPVKGTSTSTTPPPHTPPPLMPRPPAEYIKETQEEDARLSQLNGVLDGVSKLNGPSSSSPSRREFRNVLD